MLHTEKQKCQTVQTKMYEVICVSLVPEESLQGHISVTPTPDLCLLKGPPPALPLWSLENSSLPQGNGKLPPSNLGQQVQAEGHHSLALEENSGPRAGQQK